MTTTTTMTMGRNFLPNRHHDAFSFFTNPSSSSSSSPPSVVSDGNFTGNPTTTFFTGNPLDGNFHYDAAAVAADAQFGFSRRGFRRSPLAGTVEFYQRHVFLCYKSPKMWPARIEAYEFDRLPRLLYAAVRARNKDMKKKTRFTICEGDDRTEISNGDVLIFPDMIRYRRLTHFDVETFVDDVLVKDEEWIPGTPEPLRASYVFVCSHGSHDRRCGFCGPILVNRFKEEIDLRCLQGKVFVSPCSHIGGHKYAGNVIIYGSSINGEVTGHWYGYVTPRDVPVLLQEHIIKGKIIDTLWRGQMGVPEDEQKKNQERRLQLKSVRKIEESLENLMSLKNHEISTDLYGSQNNIASCCQENDFLSCCQNLEFVDRTIETEAKLSADINSRRCNDKPVSQQNGSKAVLWREFFYKPIWLEKWEEEDTFAAISVICAAISVLIAYSCYKQLK